MHVYLVPRICSLLGILNVEIRGDFEILDLFHLLAPTIAVNLLVDFNVFRTYHSSGSMFDTFIDNFYMKGFTTYRYLRWYCISKSVASLA